MINIKWLLILLMGLLGGCASHPMQPYLDDLHSRFTPASDLEVYGTHDVWAINTTGDCEDFALLAQAELGYGELRLTRTPSGQLHAVLELPDGWLLDVRYATPITREYAGYELWVEDAFFHRPNNVINKLVD